MLNVAILYGGNSSERNISYDTAISIMESLNKEKYHIIKIYIPEKNTVKWIKKILKNRIDIAIIALHGGIGEDGSIQGLLECIGIPYIGSNVLGSAIGMNKRVAKELMLYHGLNTPKFIYLNKNGNIDKIPFYLNFPLVVKPNDDGSSFGVSIVNNNEELKNAIEQLNGNLLIEEYIEGQEVTCGVIELNGQIKALDVLDINPSSKFYDYNAKYEANDTEIISSNLNKFLINKIQKIAISTFNILGAHGYARVDMIIKNNEVYVLEINTLPGMTSHSLIPKSLEKNGISCQNFFVQLINDKLKKN